MNSGPATRPQASRLRFMINILPTGAPSAPLIKTSWLRAGIGHDQEQLAFIQPGGAAIEVALLRQVRSSASRRAIRLPGGARVTDHLQQVGSHRIQPMVLGEQLVVRQRFCRCSPAAAPSTMATATT
jgi:hypothetical protein